MEPAGILAKPQWDCQEILYGAGAKRFVRGFFWLVGWVLFVAFLFVCFNSDSLKYVFCKMNEIKTSGSEEERQGLESRARLVYTHTQLLCFK